MSKTVHRKINLVPNFDMITTVYSSKTYLRPHQTSSVMEFFLHKYLPVNQTLAGYLYINSSIYQAVAEEFSDILGNISSK